MKITREELRAIIKEEVKGSKNKLVQVPDVGTYEKGQIIKSIEGKLKDMISRNSLGQHHTLEEPQLKSLLAMWSAVSEPRE
tara:strand:+ start:318 stop:560 length:243 start_codon:yes stop_codon:yes gene_type:complete